jgi:aldehyde dehydrogenase (NAD+)
MTADIFRYYGGVASEQKGETLPLGEDMLSYTRREPLGVVAAIVPWNAPVMLASLKVAMALCTGNTLVLKAAEDAPLGVLRMAEIAARHLPDGVLNVLTGYGEECGGALIEHHGIAKISFTGSTEVGRIAMRAAAERILPVSLELGGKAPAIVYPDSNDDATVQHVIAAMRFARQGQSCTAGSRLFLHEDIYDEMLEKLAARLGAMTVGDPLDEASDMGAVINQGQFDQISDYLAEGRNHPDLTTVLGGDVPTEGPLTEGFYHVPTIFAGARNDFRLAREEIFGPVLVAIKWKDIDEVVQMANDSHYGLAAYVWTHDLDDALNTAHRIESGWVQVNQGGGQVVGQSYGGYKQSGIGREASLEGMLEGFTQIKQINVKLRG